jgi:hypothetical protein
MVFFFVSFYIFFVMIFFSKFFLSILFFNIDMVENLILYFFILSFYEVCGFVIVTQVASIYEFGGVFFKIKLGFFIVYFFILLRK